MRLLSLSGTRPLSTRWWRLFTGVVLAISTDRHGRTAPLHQAQMLPAGDVQVRAVTAGTGDTTVVLLHGFGESLMTWQAVLDPLSRRFRVMALDVPGFGGSEKPDRPYTTAVQTSRIAALLDQSTGPIILVGHSMGGELAALVALERPERIVALVLIAPAGAGIGLHGLVDSVTALRASVLGWYLAGRSFLLPIHAPQWLGESSTQAKYDLTTDPAYRRATARVLREFDFQALRHRFAEIRQPTLLIWGTLDPVIPYEHSQTILSQLPCGQRLTLRAFHRPQAEQPALVTAAIQRWVGHWTCHSGPGSSGDSGRISTPPH
jgi:pimeloyl-ACP methyl ester carboxylesterase